MNKFTKRANRYGRTDRRIDPNYRKASLLTRYLSISVDSYRRTDCIYRKSLLLKTGAHIKPMINLLDKLMYLLIKDNVNVFVLAIVMKLCLYKFSLDKVTIYQPQHF